jgi:SAM-dependent methyltransferase
MGFKPRTEQYKDYHFLMRPYIRSLLRKCGVSKGSLILDVGCGIGFFSRIMARLGHRVCGLDRSSKAIQIAAQSSGDIRWIKGCAENPPFPKKSFDIVFCRDLSLYNRSSFLSDTRLTLQLLDLVGIGGQLIVVYTTNNATGIKRRVSKSGWKNWSYREIEQHFSSLKHSSYIVNTLDTLFLGKMAFCSLISRSNLWLNRTIYWWKMEVVVFVPKPSQNGHR